MSRFNVVSFRLLFFHFLLYIYIFLALFSCGNLEIPKELISYKYWYYKNTRGMVKLLPTPYLMLYVVFKDVNAVLDGSNGEGGRSSQTDRAMLKFF